jgi:tRNA threonylcarbamoyladenosine biosynthesis protein TsaB
MSRALPLALARGCADNVARDKAHGLCGKMAGGDNACMTSDAMPPSSSMRLLAIETSTDRMSVALGDGARDAATLSHSGPGAAQSSIHLLPTVDRLLGEAGWTIADLTAIVFARGPGSFTGLRTACAVTQGLAYGAQAQGVGGGLPVLPVDTLLAVAEEARWLNARAGSEAPSVIVALLDARMGELYVAVYAVNGQGVVAVPLLAPVLCAPADLAGLLQPVAGAWQATTLLAGNVFVTCGEVLARLPGRRLEVWPSATALLRVAPALLEAGCAVAAQDAMPLYVRDKVAQTTDERERLRLAQWAASAAA